jgi:hypothetical protein
MMLRLTARLLLLMLVMAAYSAPLRSQEGRITPHDEALTDASWAAFRARLLTAIEKRDRRFVLGVLDPNIRNGADAPRGVAEFRKQWELDANTGVFWRLLPSALSVGSAYLERRNRPRELCAPYVLGKWPATVDPSVYGVISARDTMVKAGPSWDTDTLTRLSYEIVRVTDWEMPDLDPGFKQNWVRIRLLKEGTGFVPEEQIRSPVEHSACFIRTARGWRMTVFGPAGRD